ncbi:MAG TPA: response regulator [Candidatus Omnitrophota bacterium]|nr:response regulator [Candidatus Omnitrophota bacterium]HRZ14730.1 response regulator [Candidatus Omnitrophota bacterium]
MKNPKKRIMIVEDNCILTMELKETLEGFGYEVPVIASRARDVVKQAREQRPDLILMDINLEEKEDGIDLARAIRTFLPSPIIFLSGYTDPATQARAREVHPYRFIGKPYDVAQLQSIVKSALP